MDRKLVGFALVALGVYSACSADTTPILDRRCADTDCRHLTVDGVTTSVCFPGALPTDAASGLSTCEMWVVLDACASYPGTVDHGRARAEGTGNACLIQQREPDASGPGWYRTTGDPTCEVGIDLITFLDPVPPDRATVTLACPVEMPSGS